MKQKSQRPDHQISEIEYQLFEKIRSGDVNAYETLFRTYYPRLCGFALKIVRSRPIAEEIVQEIFLKIWEHKATWKPHSPMQMYLYRAAKNGSFNYLKHRDIVRDWEEDEMKNISVSENDPEKGVYQAELSTAIREAIDHLPERCRLTFILHRQEGLTYTEISTVLNVSIKTVETQMGRALKTLRKLLLPYLS